MPEPVGSPPCRSADPIGRSGPPQIGPIGGYPATVRRTIMPVMLIPPFDPAPAPARPIAAALLKTAGAMLVLGYVYPHVAMAIAHVR